MKTWLAINVLTQLSLRAHGMLILLIMVLVSLSLMCVKCVQGNLLDEASGLKKEEAELVMVSATPKQPSSGGWNKV